MVLPSAVANEFVEEQYVAGSEVVYEDRQYCLG